MNSDENKAATGDVKNETDKPIGLQQPNEIEEKSTPKKKHKLAVPLLVSGIIAILLIAYGSVAIYFQTHFFPNTTVNGIGCGGLEASAAAEILQDQANNFSFEVMGRGEKEETLLGTIKAEDINFYFSNVREDVEEVLAQQNVLLWIRILAKPEFQYSLNYSTAFDETMLQTLVESWKAFQKKNMNKPEDAYIGEYSDKSKGYEIVPETQGNQLNTAEALECIKESIYQNDSIVNLEDKGCYMTAEVTAENEDLLKNLQTANTWVNSCITYDWNGAEVIVDNKLIQEWISFDKNKPILDEKAIAEYVSETASEQDTYGKKRKFTTTLGTELTLPSGAYGWKTDKEGETEELVQLIYQGAEVEKEPLYLSKGAWKGQNDIGNTYVEADLTNQHLYLYQKGTLVLETDFVSGNMSISGCVTPPGVFGLTYKTTNAVLRGQDYETPVNYWMPFNGNVGMHDATWRAAFGGDIYLTRGSHGCINLPLDKAEAIYQYVSTGFPIICYYY